MTTTKPPTQPEKKPRVRILNEFDLASRAKKERFELETRLAIAAGNHADAKLKLQQFDAKLDARTRELLGLDADKKEAGKP